MTIAFACPTCAKPFKVPDEMAGRTTNCPGCRTPLMVPSAAYATAPMAPMAAPPAAFPADAPAGSVGRRFQPSRKMMMYAGIGVLGVVLLGAVVWGGYKLFFGGSGLSDEQRYLPDKTQIIVSLHPEQLLNSDLYKEVTNVMPDLKGWEKEDKLYVAPSNISQLVMGGTLGTDGFDAVFVIKTNKAVSQGDFNQLKGARETKVKDVTVLEPMFGPAVCIPDSKIVVVGKADTLKKVLERDKKAEISDSLRAALKSADLSKTAAVAVDTKELWIQAKDLAKKMGKDLNKALEQQGMAEVPANIDGASVTIDLGKEVKVTSVVICTDKKVAEEMKRIEEGGVAMFRLLFSKPTAGTLDNFEVKTSGSQVTSILTVKSEDLVKSLKEFQKLGGAGGTIDRPPPNMQPPPVPQ